MKVYQLLKIIIRGLGIFALWKAITALTVFIGVIGVYSNIPYTGETNSFATIALFSNFFLFIIPTVFCLLAIFKTNGVISFFGITPDETSSTNISSKLNTYLIIISIGTIFIVAGSSATLSLGYKTSFNYNASLINIEEMKDGAEPIMQKTQTTETDQYTTDFSFFAFMELIFGIIILAKAKNFTAYIHSRYTTEPPSSE